MIASIYGANGAILLYFAIISVADVEGHLFEWRGRGRHVGVNHMVLMAMTANARRDVSTLRPFNCSFNSLFRLATTKTLKLCITGPCTDCHLLQHWSSHGTHNKSYAGTTSKYSTFSIWIEYNKKVNNVKVPGGRPWIFCNAATVSSFRHNHWVVWHEYGLNQHAPSNLWTLWS